VPFAKGMTDTLSYHDTDFRHKHLGKSTDEEELLLLIAEREELPEFYKNHIAFTLTGLKKMHC
jgi:hypothetical protein